ncbi:uncharacterized protein LOC126907853 isoform X2 [Daktulosphaira vitifoliae]|uniref:uncharacterized protein LOC126907853 isoform X1 n=1 Tax=Daktulosphaira vitifoliae TaxID=58002 RepID=UPI0021AA2E1F|nr:uncharacterized protein LOC126907853 isoform X1 [Daktulosphaira vitifoliae]XP_050545456.1 uncharacterized protein LOC126907853 isoform X2 [Daktulosphaira vitifoliae]
MASYESLIKIILWSCSLFNLLTFCETDNTSDITHYIRWTNNVFLAVKNMKNQSELLFHVILWVHTHLQPNKKEDFDKTLLEYKILLETLIPMRQQKHSIESEKTILNILFEGKYKNSTLQTLKIRRESLEPQDNLMKYDDAVKQRMNIFRRVAAYYFNNTKSSDDLCQDYYLHKCFVAGLLNYIDNPKIIKQKGGCSSYGICAFDSMDINGEWQIKQYSFTAQNKF